MAANSGAGPSVEDVLQELDKMHQALLAKDEDLRLAGQIGTILLEKNEEANTKIAELVQQLEQHEKEIEQWK